MQPELQRHATRRHRRSGWFIAAATLCIGAGPVFFSLLTLRGHLACICSYLAGFWIQAGACLGHFAAVWGLAVLFLWEIA